MHRGVVGDLFLAKLKSELAEPSGILLHTSLLAYRVQFIPYTHELVDVGELLTQIVHKSIKVEIYKHLF